MAFLLASQTADLSLEGPRGAASTSFDELDRLGDGAWDADAAAVASDSDDDFFVAPRARPARAVTPDDPLALTLDVEALFGGGARRAAPAPPDKASLAAYAREVAKFATLEARFGAATLATARDVVAYCVERGLVTTLVSAKVVAYAALFASAKFYETAEVAHISALVRAANAGLAYPRVTADHVRAVELALLRHLGFDVLAATRALRNGPRCVTP